MKKLSNLVFLRLAEGRSNRLRIIAEKRYEKQPNGFLTEAELNELATICTFSHEPGDTQWLRTVGTLLSNGKMEAMLKGKFSFDDHVTEVKRLVAEEKIPFGIRDLVVIKESGKSGVIADYNVETKEYLVILNPFQLRTVPASSLLVPAAK